MVSSLQCGLSVKMRINQSRASRLIKVRSEVMGVWQIRSLDSVRINAQKRTKIICSWSILSNQTPGKLGSRKINLKIQRS